MPTGELWSILVACPNNMCYRVHICRRCHSECHCGTYDWACPWRGGDEDDMCGACMELTKAEMEAWEDEQERLRGLV